MGRRLQQRTATSGARDGVPAERFRLVPAAKDPSSVPVYAEEDQKDQWVLRRVASNGVVSVDNQLFSVGNAFKGALVDVLVDDTTIQVWSQNHLIKTVARLRKDPGRKVRADGLHVSHQAPRVGPGNGGTPTGPVIEGNNVVTYRLCSWGAGWRPRDLGTRSRRWRRLPRPTSFGSVVEDATDAPCPFSGRPPPAWRNSFLGS